MKRNIRRSGFTLIELIVSMGILMAVTGIVAMASKSFYDGYDRSARVTRRLKEYMAIDNIMDVHVRNMIPFQWKDDNSNHHRYRSLRTRTDRSEPDPEHPALLP